MNYIAEINSFYSWVMFYPLPPDAQALWHALLQLNNRCAVQVGGKWFWKVEFTVPNKTLISILSFSRQQLDRMRNVLIQAGRIVYRKGKGNQSGTYRIIPFDDSVVEKSVENCIEKLWMGIEANNVTQSVTQLDTQTGHKQLHKAGTNPDLCNIFGTLINSNNINNNYNNNKFHGDGDESQAKLPKSYLSDYLQEINSYFGMTEAIKQEAKNFTECLFEQYFLRRPSKQDIIMVFERSHQSFHDDLGNWSLVLNDDKKSLLQYAFSVASATNQMTWTYIDGILSKVRDRGLKNAEDCERYDLERKYPKN